MTCSHLLENGKCSLIGHFYSKEGFTLDSKKKCIHEFEKHECKYYVEEEEDEELKDDFYGEYEDYENEIGRAHV